MGVKAQKHAEPAQDQNSSSLEYAEALANQLVRHLGFDGAEKTCRENHWGGVLDVIRVQRGDH